ncbi:hypothetical protein EHZ19_04855 [Paraburkholderia bannensis]|uniref:Tfp pilus assembly protein PilX n=1 Tax=Paraburkholderia tropica TaxID=92647 RepID=A0A1A5X2F0_9BURK|nr:hypothetical protein A6456_31905 [Paraburkholderia tropica]QNB12134.1 pilus assembly protein [Paraburkholderia tropica]RQM49726.1 hypothetical protein EHZ19_04855 [Paraburkholderia bannensis]RQN36795.1 hypothetical protein EHZ25_22845 [Paraburkholderia tropica]SEK08368.1 hypothetical protein SAMN05216550_116214 [Paraburkholderia tropica]
MMRDANGCVGRSVRERGVALPVVLVIVSTMLVTSAAWFESSLFEARSAAGMADHLQAFHAADAALIACTRTLIDGTAAASATPAQSGEPAGWKRSDTFAAQAATPIASWPASVRPPQCLVEPWRIATRPEARAYLVTARGYGATENAQSWLQMQVVFDGTRVEQHWRRIVTRPF